MPNQQFITALQLFFKFQELRRLKKERNKLEPGTAHKAIGGMAIPFELACERGVAAEV